MAIIRHKYYAKYRKTVRNYAHHQQYTEQSSRKTLQKKLSFSIIDRQCNREHRPRPADRSRPPVKSAKKPRISDLSGTPLTLFVRTQHHFLMIASLVLYFWGLLLTLLEMTVPEENTILRLYSFGTVFPAGSKFYQISLRKCGICGISTFQDFLFSNNEYSVDNWNFFAFNSVILLIPIYPLHISWRRFHP